MFQENQYYLVKMTQFISLANDEMPMIKSQSKHDSKLIKYAQMSFGKLSIRWVNECSIQQKLIYLQST